MFRNLTPENHLFFDIRRVEARRNPVRSMFNIPRALLVLIHFLFLSLFGPGIRSGGPGRRVSSPRRAVSFLRVACHGINCPEISEDRPALWD